MQKEWDNVYLWLLVDIRELLPYRWYSDGNQFHINLQVTKSFMEITIKLPWIPVERASSRVSGILISQSLTFLCLFTVEELECHKIVMLVDLRLFFQLEYLITWKFSAHQQNNYWYFSQWPCSSMRNPNTLFNEGSSETCLKKKTV
jgi:hypothetical protein